VLHSIPEVTQEQLTFKLEYILGLFLQHFNTVVWGSSIKDVCMEGEGYGPV